jgi:ethanolamine utilization microcompartment shell protein EutS
MKKMKKTTIIRNILGAAVLLTAVPSAAQTALCKFADATTYDSLAVYDPSPYSPFFNGTLKGNIQIVDYTNESGTAMKALGLQRSRFGSERFGAKIRLHTPIALTTATQYVHANIRSDKGGRAMLIGLGKRNDNTTGSDQVVQFWTLANASGEAGTWYDAVFPIYGHDDISVSSLIVVPDAESRQDLTEDFATYISDITLSSNGAPTISGDYAVNFDKTTTMKRTDRYLGAIQLVGSVTTTTQSINTGNQAGNSLMYVPLLTQQFQAVAGETLTPKFSYTGSWMHGFVYLDEENDGTYSFTINNDYTPNSDLKAYSGYSRDGSKNNYHNSTGTNTANNNPGVNPPSFVLNANLKPGFYRMRYKVDWCSLDPGGNLENNIINNGGCIVDTRLNVHADKVSITVQERNGDVLGSDGKSLSGTTTAFGQPITITLRPESGFKQNGIILRHGYNMEGDSLVHGTPQWTYEQIPASSFVNGSYTIPATMVDGNLLITAEFAENANGVKNVSMDTTGSNGRTYSLNGQLVRTEDTKGLAKGIYISNGKKQVLN